MRHREAQIARVDLLRGNDVSPSTANKDAVETHIPWAFPSMVRNSIDGVLKSALPRVARLDSAGAHATYGIDASASTLDQAKMLVFLSRCSNPNAVFAIPAGTERHRHSLMARRAAWRRSERRRRSQRRRRARGRQSAGRKSKVLAASSLRLRTTSLTASHGPARVEEQ